MDISIILKIAGVGLLVAVIYQILNRTGRDEQAMFVTLGGVIVVLLMLVSEIGRLIDTVKSVFNL